MGKKPSNKEKDNIIDLDISEINNILSSQKNRANKRNNKNNKINSPPKRKKKENIPKIQSVKSEEPLNEERKKMIKKYGGYYDENDEFIIDDELSYSSESEDEKNFEDIEIIGQKLSKTNKNKTLKSHFDEMKKLDLSEEEYENFSEEELNYWKNLSKNERQKLKDLEKEIDEFDSNEVPERFRLLNFPVSLSIKKNIMQRITQLDMMEPTDPEFFKLDKWISGIMNVPFGKYINLPVSNTNSKKEIYEFISHVSETMDSSIYGHNDAKNKIMQVVCQWISNPNSTGNIIALQGPPGIGKTSLVRNGISKALKRPFHMIALGGATDSTFLEGHSYTYEGSNWGRISNILMESKCMNPVIFFDELDKISATKQGEEITGVLTHLTDLTQNSNFNDKYFSGIDMDLSRCLFIFSYNDENAINPILKDRLIKINLKGFSIDDKLKIAKEYLLKELYKNIGLNENDINFPDYIIKNIINEYTEEEGVRELKRCLETILLKINMAKYTNLPNVKPLKIGNELQHIKLPIEIDKKLLQLLLNKNYMQDNISKNMMYI